MAQGTVMWFDAETGFGFITEDQRVTFETRQGPKGRQATDVRVV